MKKEFWYKKILEVLDDGMIIETGRKLVVPAQDWQEACGLMIEIASYWTDSFLDQQIFGGFDTFELAQADAGISSEFSNDPIPLYLPVPKNSS